MELLARLTGIPPSPKFQAADDDRAIGEIDQRTWIVRVQHKPVIGWIWVGCLLMALGGLLAASDRRYRLGERKNTIAATATA